MDEYAMYKGDHFIDLGTLSYLAHKYHKRADSLKFLSYPSAHRKSHGDRLLLYKIEDD
ncbi:integrase [Lactobacillus crispatus]|uniref:integrase n=1 Tax=Lactobacillus crispatus TaxID=47770 RepID=UPI001039D6AD|nr:integrase [Lactobacillus crispatus]